MKNVLLLSFIFLNTLNLCSQTGWFQINSNTPNDAFITSVFFGDISTGYICGSYNNGNIKFIRKTTNQGNSWDSVNIFTTSKVNKMFFTSATTGFVTGKMIAGQYYDGDITKTTNSGVNWYYSYPSYSSEFYGIQLISDNTGFAVGYLHNMTTDAKVIFKTTNAGSFWFSSVTYYNTYDRLYDVYFPSVETGYVVGSGSLLKTTNTGSTWNTLSQYISVGYSVYFINNNTGFIGGYSGDMGIIGKTINGGSNWSTVLSIDSAVINKIRFVNSNTGFAVANKNNYGVIYKTINSGNNWVLQKITQGPLQDVFFINESTGFACSDQGMLWKTIDGGGSIGIQQISTKTPQAYNLYQNYPNPFNPITSIRVDILRKDNVKLTIFNILGNEIISLINQTLQPGSYKVSWNGINQPSGIYFYKFETNSFKETKRMILIK